MLFDMNAIYDECNNTLRTKATHLHVSFQGKYRKEHFALISSKQQNKNTPTGGMGRGGIIKPE